MLFMDIFPRVFAFPRMPDLLALRTNCALQLAHSSKLGNMTAGQDKMMHQGHTVLSAMTFRTIRPISGRNNP
jgi:hypothetical protein